MKNKPFLIAWCITIIFLSIVCRIASASPSPKTAPYYESDYDITGTWKGRFSTNLVSYVSVKLNLKQEGTRVKGTFRGSGGQKGKIRGRFKGEKLNFTIQTTTSGCSGRFSGAARLNENGDTMRFNFTGSDCAGTHKNGRGTVYLQE